MYQDRPRPFAEKVALAKRLALDNADATGSALMSSSHPNTVPGSNINELFVREWEVIGS